MNAPSSLIISNPPHGLVDAKRAAPHLDLLPVELVLKAHYAIPEIWLAPSGRAAADQTAMALRDAGLAVAVAPTAAFRDVPPQAHVESFAFEPDGLTLALDERDVVLPYDLPIVVVACSPRDVPPQREGSGAWGVFADVYADAAGGLVRCGIDPGTTDFSALPGTALAGPAGRLARLLEEFEGRFKRLVVDRRMMHLQVRRRTAPPPGMQRKGFAFGAPALTELLQSLAPDLADLSQCELCSRLVYLTRR